MTLGLLRRRNFALLWFGQLISVTGDLVLFIALPFYVYELTGSALATGGMFMAHALPPLVLGSVAGVFVDRWDRRRTMIVADLLRAGLLLFLLVVRSPGRLWILYLVATLESALSQFFLPAKGALLPALVGEKDLMAANSLDAAGNAVTRLVGPSLGGALMSLLGLTSVVLLDAASYLVSGVLIFLISAPPQGAAGAPRTAFAPGAVWREWLAGLRLVRAQRLLAGLFVVAGLAAFAQGIFNVLLVPFVKDVLGGSAMQLGWLATAQGVGALAGALLITRRADAVEPRRLIALGLGIVGVILLIVVHLRSLPVAVALFVLIGGPVTGYMIATQTLMQASVANEFRGRIFGSYGTTAALLLMIGMGLAGALGSVAGTVPMLDLTAGLFVAGGVVGWLSLRSAGTVTGAEAPAGTVPDSSA